MYPQTTRRADCFWEHDLCKDDSCLWPFLSWKMASFSEYLISFLPFCLVLRIHLSLGLEFCPASTSFDFVFFFLGEYLKYFNLGISLSVLLFSLFSSNDYGFALTAHCRPALKVHTVWFSNQVRSLFSQFWTDHVCSDLSSRLFFACVWSTVSVTHVSWGTEFALTFQAWRIEYCFW